MQEFSFVHTENRPDGSFCVYYVWFHEYTYDDSSSGSGSDSGSNDNLTEEGSSQRTYNRKAVLYSNDRYGTYFYQGIWISLTTYDSDNQWYVYSTSTEAVELDDDYNPAHVNTVSQGSGIVTNKLIYVPHNCRFRIYYYADNPPRMLGSGARAFQ